MAQGYDNQTKRASVTANIVSAARGVGVSSELRDPLAAAFATGWRQSALRAFDRDSRRARLARAALRALSLGIVDHNTVRMLVVDQYLARWAKEGARQVVIIGAGFDSRRWRLPALANLCFFEVDHESSQHLKQERALGLKHSAEQHHYVPLDLEKERLSGHLPRTGFDPSLATAWVCEGVAAYLPIAAIRALLADVGALSAPGSRLALSYVTPPDSAATTTTKAVVGKVLAKLGEHARGLVTRDTLLSLTESAGLAVLEDLAWSDWKRRVPSYSAFPNLIAERLLIAGKDRDR